MLILLERYYCSFKTVYYNSYDKRPKGDTSAAQYIDQLSQICGGCNAKFVFDSIVKLSSLASTLST